MCIGHNPIRLIQTVALVGLQDIIGARIDGSSALHLDDSVGLLRAVLFFSIPKVSATNKIGITKLGYK